MSDTTAGEVSFNFQLDQELKAKLTSEADRLGISSASLVRMVLSQYFANGLHLNPPKKDSESALG